MEFHEILQTHSYVLDTSRARGPILLETFPFVILNINIFFAFTLDESVILNFRYKTFTSHVI